MYGVHMRSWSATEARKNWFRLLDEVAAGEVVEIWRDSKRIVLRCEPLEEAAPAPDYRALIKSDAADQADQWGWSWDEDSGLTAEFVEGHDNDS